MGFRIFARGANFHYERNNNIDGDEFEVVRILDILKSTDPTPTGVLGAASDVASGPSDEVQAAHALATVVLVHRLRSAIDFLALRARAADSGWIAVATNVSHIIMPDSGSFAIYDFSPGDNPGVEFMKIIGPSLRSNSMNHWGVLRAMVTALDRYNAQVDESVSPMINIRLSK